MRMHCMICVHKRNEAREDNIKWGYAKSTRRQKALDEVGKFLTGATLTYEEIRADAESLLGVR